MIQLFVYNKQLKILLDSRKWYKSVALRFPEVEGLILKV
jgi:hypothetical protein